MAMIDWLCTLTTCTGPTVSPPTGSSTKPRVGACRRAEQQKSSQTFLNVHRRRLPPLKARRTVCRRRFLYLLALSSHGYEEHLTLLERLNLGSNGHRLHDDKRSRTIEPCSIGLVNRSPRRPLNATNLHGHDAHGGSPPNACPRKILRAPGRTRTCATGSGGQSVRHSGASPCL